MAETTQNAKGEAKAASKKADSNEHSAGGVTTRQDAHDLGVEMLPGDAREAVGPEDALGEGPKRGDYRLRQDGSVHVQFVATEDGGEPIRNDDGAVIDFKPNSVPVVQNDRVEDIGDEPARKGGVTT